MPLLVEKACRSGGISTLIHSVGGSFDFEDTFQKITETVTIHDRSVFTVRFLCGLEVYYDGR